MRIIYLFFLPGLLLSCSKQLRVNEPSFDVQVNSKTAKVGDKVQFNLSGDPDIITFYSGEVGNEYEYRNKDRKFPTLSMDLSFESMVRPNGGGTAGYCQPNQFHLYVGYNFKLEGNTKQDTINAIRNTNWKDISDQFSWSPLECKSTTPYFPSGKVNVMSLFEPGKQLHFAFQYINRPNSTNGTANIWRFTSFKLTSTVEYVGVKTVLDQNTAGWSRYYIGNNWVNSNFSNAASVVTMRGLVNATNEEELWCVSRGIEGSDSTNLGKEFGVTVKSFAGFKTDTYSHTYSKPGTYTVTFVAANSNVDDRKEIVRQLVINVTP